MYRVDERLVQAAIELANRRFPTGEEGAAAVYLEDGQILTSCALHVVNESVSLCHEVGTMCDAVKIGKRIVATVCVSRDLQGRFYILSPCGVCQERLWAWGGDVECAVPLPDNPFAWQSIKLRELSPYYWRKPFIEGDGILESLRFP